MPVEATEADAPARPLIYGQMSKVAASLTHIPKQSGANVSYEFRGIDAVMQALHGPLTAHGVFYVTRVLPDWQLNMIPGTNNRMQAQALFRVEVEFFAEDGSSVVASAMAQSHDYGDKAVYQAQQNAIKYVLLQAFCIPVDEPDMDGRTPDDVPADEPPTPETLDTLEERITQAQALEIAGDYDAARTYAAVSEPQAKATIARLDRQIEEKA